ncbi:MAG: hypothetical protein NXI16_07585 [Alphaproteobacteria bacterium]|nr:hypothetical protein [Alphaproteobacteria bacterium]
MHRAIQWLTILMLSGAIAACTNSSTYLKKGNGTVASFENTTYEEVWEAAFKVVARGLTINERDKRRGVIRATEGIGTSQYGSISYGQVVAVFIEESKSGIIMLEVVSENRSFLETALTTASYEEDIINLVQATLAGQLQRSQGLGS